MENSKTKMIYSAAIVLIAAACIVFLMMTELTMSAVIVSIALVAVISCVLIFTADHKTHVLHD